MIPACRALVAPIELATGKQAYFIGKPNPLIMRTGRKMLGLDSKDIAIIGDRMDTDIVSGIESGIDTVLVLSGVSDMTTVNMFPYRPTYILDGVGDIINK
jgi:NagD protein